MSVAVGVLIAVLAWQVWMTVRVLRSDLFEREQRLWQARLIWLLPVVGAAFVFALLKDEEESARRWGAITRDKSADERRG